MNISRLKNETILCTITKNELTKNNIKLNELTQGTPAVKELFNEIMEYIKNNYNYEHKKIMFLTEVIPIDKENIILALYEPTPKH